MRINTNVPSLQAVSNLNKTNKVISRAMRSMSTGKKINSAADDAAGLAVANKLRVQVQGLNRASQNALDGISLIQTAEGALGEIHNMLQRMRELSVQAANDTNEDGSTSGEGDRGKILMEIEALTKEITDTAKKTEYNKIKILSGELYTWDGNPTSSPLPAEAIFDNDLTLQIGPNENMDLGVSIPKITSKTLKIDGVTLVEGGGKTSVENCTSAITTYDNAISYVSQLRADLGATQNRLEHTISSLDTTSINTEQARSRIEDTNMGEAMTEYSSKNVISQAGMSILAQSNQRPQAILQLLG